MWNPIIEQIEGTLCGKGLMTETFDLEKDELSRSLTPLGKFTAENLLEDPEWRKIYLYMAKKKYAHLSIELRRKIWTKIANQLRDIKERKKE